MSGAKFMLSFIILFFLLAASFGANTQAAEPVSPGQLGVVTTLSHQKYPDRYEPGKPGAPRPKPSAATPGAAQISLGQPGTSYQFIGNLGFFQQPYFADTEHLNRPHGLFIDGANNLYISEESGQRVLKYNSSKVNQYSLGIAGVSNTGDYSFTFPRDVTVDSAGNLWEVDGNRVVQYDSSGQFLQQFPETNPWESGNDDGHFEQVSGVAVDQLNHLFVADGENHRVQVFDLSSGKPVYNTTIGITDTPGTALGQFNYPGKIAVDNLNRLLVVDENNNRVQRCADSGGWACVVITDDLNYALGIAVDNSNDIYIADTGNSRIVKCSAAGVCNPLTADTYWLYDVAVDNQGNIYGAASYEDVIVKYNSNGVEQGIYLGEYLVPYLTDNYHYFKPRITFDSAGNILILEEGGQRLTKLDPHGTFLWSFGVPGVDAWDNQHFNYPHGLDTDASGKIYVAENCRVRIFSSEGVLLDNLGTGCGSGNYEFGWAMGLAVDSQNNIYVADGPNHRVQIYNSSLFYTGSIGVTGECSSANDRLCYPGNVEIDSGGNIFVADGGNNRIQKFNSSRQWLMTIGTPGDCGDNFGQFCWVEDVAVDGQGRIFATDWNYLQVFDPNGAFLTSIGGAWGENSSQFMGLSSVAIDPAGAVFLSDWENARIQKFAFGVLGWRQVNLNGFGDRRNWAAYALQDFQGLLYAGTWNESGTGAQIWRMTPTGSWSPIVTDGFGDGDNFILEDLGIFNGQVYASTGNWAPSKGGGIYRSSDGTTWTPVVTNGFGDDRNVIISALTEFNGMLYTSAGGWDTGKGADIWRTSTGASQDWGQVVANGFDNDPNNYYAPEMIVFNGYLYAGTYNHVSGAEVWRTSNGTVWTQANTDGFGELGVCSIIGMTVFENALYAGVNKCDNAGGEIWRTTNGTNWTKVMVNGFGDANNRSAGAFVVFEDDLFIMMENNITGIEIWRSSDGENWRQVSPDGLGDSNNIYGSWGHSFHVYNDRLYLLTNNSANGGEVWQMLPSIYLPIINR